MEMFNDNIASEQLSYQGNLVRVSGRVDSVDQLPKTGSFNQVYLVGLAGAEQWDKYWWNIATEKWEHKGKSRLMSWSELSDEIGAVRSDLSAEVSAVRSDLSAEVSAVQSALPNTKKDPQHSGDDILLGSYTIGTRETGTVGRNSFAQGDKNLASALYSHAEGYATQARRHYAHAEGYQTSAGGADVSTPNGIASHAEGRATSAWGDYAHAEGYKSSVGGEAAHAEGVEGAALGKGAHKEGFGGYAKANYSHTEGGYNWAGIGDEEPSNFTKGQYSHAEGLQNGVSGTAGHVEGFETRASGDYAHAQGSYTAASGVSSHAEGNKTVAAGSNSHAEGESTTASETCSHVEGINGRADSGAVAAHVQGTYGTAQGAYSHVGGNYCKSGAWGKNGTVSGNGCFVNSHNSLVHGNGLTSYYSCSTVLGQINKDISSTKPANSNYTYRGDGDALVIGNGTSAAAKSNAFRVTFDGKVYGLSSFNSSGADYAEYFEWADANPQGDNHLGKFVTLEGEKIRIATSADTDIIGIVSCNPSMVGNAWEDNWKGMYVRDMWGRVQYHYVDVPAEYETVTRVDEEGNEVEEQIEVSPARQDYVPMLNPAYHSDQIYEPRSARPEWAIVGMMGQLVVCDDGSCVPNGYCAVSDDGIATSAATGWRVMKRLDDTHVVVLFK